MQTPPSLGSIQLADNKDVAVHRCLCTYHQLTADVAQPVAFVAFRDATARRMPEEDFDFRAAEHAHEDAADVRRPEIDLIRTPFSVSLNV